MLANIDRQNICMRPQEFCVTMKTNQKLVTRTTAGFFASLAMIMTSLTTK